MSSATKIKPVQASAPEFKTLDLSDIGLSPTNPRKTFNETKLEELTESVRQKGVLEPILVRPNPGYHVSEDLSEEKRAWRIWPGKVVESGKPSVSVTGRMSKPAAEALCRQMNEKAYEMVAGERRWRAATRAQLSVIPAIVREMTDREALEIQVIENAQREDVPALEEADGYQMLIKTHGYTVDEISEKTGKSKSYVYGVLKLCDLPQVARDEMGKGELSASVAQLIARIPNGELREKAAKEICSPHVSWRRAYRAAKEHIEANYVVELKGAPFSRKDATLVPAAGACDTCPKQSGNNRAEYPDGRADICNDPPCFAEKKAAHNARLLQAAGEKGFAVLDEKESRKIYPYGSSMTYGAAYVDLASQCDEDKRRRSYRQLLGESVKPVIAQDPNGGIHYVVPKATAFQALEKTHGIKLRSSGGVSHTDRERAIAEKRMKEVCRLTAASLSADMAAAAAMTGNRGRMMRVLVEVLVANSSATAEIVCKRRGLEILTEKTSYGSQVASPRKTLDEAMRGMSDGAVDGLLAEILFMGNLSNWRQGWSKDAPKEAAFFVLDFEAERKSQETAVKQKATAKTKPKGAVKS